MGKASRKKNGREKRIPPSIQSSIRWQSYLFRPFPIFILLTLLALTIYSNTFDVPFHLDDVKQIAENVKIKQSPALISISESRYVGVLSFSLNYHLGGLNVFGYHLVNFLIHILNVLVVYSLISQLIKTPLIRNSLVRLPAKDSIITPQWIPLAVALLFLAHPIQTQAVTYIIQRFASLAALFYLISLVAYLKGRLAPFSIARRSLWYGAALISGILAMRTKENTFTLPLMILLTEAVFFKPSWKRQWKFLVPLAITLAIIPFSLLPRWREDFFNFIFLESPRTAEISTLDYLFTQFPVITTYIRLLLIPVNQNLDYDYPIYHTLLTPAVIFSFLFLLLLFSLAIYLLIALPSSSYLARLVGFGILWFFLTLSIESSIIPIRDVIFEHRVYLPSVGFFLALSAAVAGGVEYLKTKGYRKETYPKAASWTAVAFALAIFSLSVATYQRNFVWRDGVSLWQDVARKSPSKVRAHIFLGREYEIAGRLGEAIHAYRNALALDPNLSKVHNNLGFIYRALGQNEEAIMEYQAALALDPKLETVHNNLGNIYYDQGHINDAIEAYQAALALDPKLATTHYNLGRIYKDQQRWNEALQEFQTARSLRPDFVLARSELGLVYLSTGQIQEAIFELEKARALDPQKAEIHHNLGIAYMRAGNFEEARRGFEHALKIRPDFELAQSALESLPNPKLLD